MPKHTRLSNRLEVTMKVLESLSAAIAAEGIDHIFAVIGDANRDIIVELCEKHGLKYVHAHHEMAAVGMADGYSRFCGKIGLATTTQGPGYTNATTSLVSAHDSSSNHRALANVSKLQEQYNVSSTR
jgi:acetolactate synthase I/II/III large subunit